MPVYRGIKISIISQYGTQALPEYSPSRIFDHNTLSPPPDALPALLDSTSHTATVYIPILPSSMFWLRYHVYVPVATYYYFKAFLNGKHLVSWGTGEIDDFKGKVMFGLFESRGGAMPERQLLAFSDDASLDGQAKVSPGQESLEVRVYRSKGRRSVSESAPTFSNDFQPCNSESYSPIVDGPGVRFRHTLALKPGGEVDYGHPINRYHYALIDPLDSPCAVFRWLPRTWQELEELDVDSVESERGTQPSIESRLSSKDQPDDCHQSTDTDSATGQDEETQRLIPVQMDDDVSPLRVPVFQVPKDTELNSQSTTHGSRGLLDSIDNNSPTKPQFNRLAPQGPALGGFNAHRNLILEPCDELDRYAAAPPSHSSTLLQSVVSQLKAAGSTLHRPRPGSPDSTQALQRYLRRHSSEKLVVGQKEAPLAGPAEAQPRPISWRGQIHQETNENVRGVKNRPPTPFASLPSVISDKPTNFHDSSSCLIGIGESNVTNVLGVASEPTLINPAVNSERHFSLAASTLSSSAECPVDSAQAQQSDEESIYSNPDGSSLELIPFGGQDGSIPDARQRVKDRGPQPESTAEVLASQRKQVRHKQSFGARLLGHFHNSNCTPDLQSPFGQLQSSSPGSGENHWSRSWKKIFNRQLDSVPGAKQAKDSKEEHNKPNSSRLPGGKLQKKGQ